MVRPPRTHLRQSLCALLCVVPLGCTPSSRIPIRTGDSGSASPTTIRVATFNIRDLRGSELDNPGGHRIPLVVDAIRRIDADVLVVQELRHNGVVDTESRESRASTNAARFAELIAVWPATPGGPDAIRYTPHSFASNTGVHSGRDLDRNGVIDPRPGTPVYAGDCLGWGEVSGQYAMAVLVKEGLRVGRARTFAGLRWRDMPGALLPQGDGDRVPTDRDWYTPEMLEVVRLSSKNHIDFPVMLADGTTVHMLVSHPTPPVFDGPEDRNGRRNHDEIRFWAEYTGHGVTPDADWIEDDAGRTGGLAAEALYVIVGDLNAELSENADGLDPVGTWLTSTGAVNNTLTPRSVLAPDGERSEATATWGKRVDYVLEGPGLTAVRGAVYRGPADAPPPKLGGERPPDPPHFPPIESASDHFPVWLDITLSRTK